MSSPRKKLEERLERWRRARAELDRKIVAGERQLADLQDERAPPLTAEVLGAFKDPDDDLGAADVLARLGRAKTPRNMDAVKRILHKQAQPNRRQLVRNTTGLYSRRPNTDRE